MKRGEIIKSITEKLAVMSPRRLVLIALAISVVIAGIMYIMIAGFLVPKTQPNENAMQQTVVMAAVDIPERTRITRDMVKLVEVPSSMIPQGAVHTVNEAVGKVSSQKIRKGDVVTAQGLIAGTGLASMIPEGMRAITIPITDVTGIAGLVKPGDSVDVFLISNKAYKNAIYGKLVLQKVQLLAVNQSFGSETAGDDKTKDQGGKKQATVGKTGMATIAVLPSDVLRVQGALSEGTLYLALRPDTGDDADVVIPDYFQYMAGGQEAQPAQTQTTAAPVRQTPAASYYPAPAATRAMPAVTPSSGGNSYSPASGSGIEVIRGNSVSQVNVK